MLQIRTRRPVVALCAMANALTAGSMFTYPIFSPALQSLLGFSSGQLSGTASIAILVQYLSAAFWGSLADRRGPAFVSLVAGLSFFVGYAAIALFLTYLPPQGPTATPFLVWFAITLAYSTCASATGASYFAAITAATIVFGDSHPGLSIAGPASLFGLSPLLFTFLATRFFDHDDHFDVLGYLYLLAIVTLVVNVCGSIGLPSPLPLLVHHTNPESAPLLTSAAQPHHSTSASNVPVSEPSYTSATALKSFLGQPTFWCLGLALLLAAGPAEMTIASIGVVTDSLSSTPVPVSHKARLVQLISISNTITRITSGWASDKLCHDEPGAGVRRLTFLALAPILYATVCGWIAIVGGSGKLVWALSLSTGICYGTLFTLAPSVVARIWPIKDFGRNYGILCYFAAVGSFIFTFLFGWLFETFDPNNDNNSNGSIIRLIYGLSSLSEVLAVGFTFGLYHYCNHYRSFYYDDDDVLNT